MKFNVSVDSVNLLDKIITLRAVRALENIKNRIAKLKFVTNFLTPQKLKWVNK